MALVLPEIQIERVLKNGFKKLPSQIDLLSDLLREYPEEMISEAKKYLSEHIVTVNLNWPREGQTQPCVNIINAGDAEQIGNDTLGDFLHEVESLSDESLVEMRGIAKQGTYSLMCLTQDPRLALYISLFAESILILNSLELQAAGMHNITLSSSDLRFEEGLLPEWANSRLVTLSCLHYHAVAVSEPVIEAFVLTLTPEVPDGEG